jgi:hypothetical protein
MWKWLKNLNTIQKSRKVKLKKEPLRINILETSDPFYAEIVKLKLEEQGIPVVVFDQRDSSYNAFGFIYLSIFKHDEEAAKQIINDEQPD